MNKNIHLKYLWKVQDIITGFKYHRKSSTAYRILDIIYLIIGIKNILLGLRGIFILNNLGSLSTIVFGIFFLLINKLQLYFYGRSFKKLNYENKQVEWDFSQDKIIHRLINLSESTLSWDLIHGILDTPHGFLLYPQQNQFYWLPKAAFSNEEDITHFVFIAQDKVPNWQKIS